MPTSAEHVATPGRSVASDDSADTIVVNPANVAWLPAPELRWTWVDCPDDATKVGCGHSWELATPLPFDLATGLRVDLVQPPWGAPGTGLGFPYQGSDYTWITWALAARLSDRASFGVSLERSYSQNPFVDGLFGISAALSWRPNTHFGFSAVARDFNRPSSELVPTSTGESLPILDARYTLAMAFRPTGRRDVDVGLEAQYWQGSAQWTPRATLGVDVPGVGRAFGSVEAAHLPNDTRRGVLGTAGLEVYFGGLGAGGGALFGDGLAPGGSAAGYATVSLSGAQPPGLPRPQRAVWLRVESTPGTRAHVALLRALWGLADEADVAAVTLVVRAEPASSLAHAEEIADALRLLRARGKRVLCSLEDGGARSLYACASADRVVASPGGVVRYSGLKAQFIYLKGLLDKIGVRAQMVRIGPHKTAPEQLTEAHALPVAHEDHVDMLRQSEAVFVRNLSLYRHMSEERVREITSLGPFMPAEARAAGLVDGAAFDDELESATQELVGRRVPYVKYEEGTPVPAQFGGPGKVAILYLDGDIVDGRSRHVPLVDLDLVGSYTMADAIRELRDDPGVRAVVLRIESGGGSSVASDVMWRELMLLRKKKPLIVSMGSMAASGGYYVASASRNIYALPLTLTGSIGVFYGKADVSGLLDKLGITVDTYRTAPHADVESAFRPFTPEEEAGLSHKVQQIYDVFLDRVNQGRGLPRDEVDAVGRGRVWMGQQAYDRHLVDHLGGLREALDEARAEAWLPKDAPIVELPRERPTLLQRALDLAGLRSEAHDAVAAALPAPLQSLARAVAPLVVYRSDEALARVEWVDAEAWAE
jgi:protease-4